ncbi:unnamed protein product, partial [Protopolystoma xenopodis]
MASYKRQSKEQLSRLCEERGIAVANQTKEWLIASLLESDQESSTGQVGQTMDIAIGQYHSDESGSNKREAAERQAEREAAAAEREAAERQAERQFQLEMARLQK